MDAELLKEAILDSIKNISIGLRWKTINIGSQGSIPKNQQVKALHIYVDKLDINMAKLLLMALYASKQAKNIFPLTHPDATRAGAQCCTQHQGLGECGQALDMPEHVHLRQADLSKPGKLSYSTMTVRHLECP